MSSDLIKFPKIVILLLLFTFATFLGVLFTPAIPEIAGDFNISTAMAGSTMSVFLIGYAIGQLPYGPLANRFGRKKAITIGVVIALIGTVMAFFAQSFWVLLLARFIQAIGSSVGLKVGFTMIGDMHAGESAAKALATLSLAFGFMPGLATAIGGFVTVMAGWRGCFLVLVIYTVVLWLLCQVLPETAKELHKDALDLNKIGPNYMRQFKDPFVVLHAFLTGLSTAVIYIFTTIAPSISIERIGLTPDQFGLWAMVPSLGMLAGGVVARRLSKQNPRINMLSGMLLTLIPAAILSLLFAKSIVNVWTLFIPTSFMFMGLLLVWSSALSHGLSETKDKSNGSAVMQFINVGTATVGVFLAEVVSPTTTMLFPAALGIILILMFATWLRLKAHH